MDSRVLHGCSIFGGDTWSLAYRALVLALTIPTDSVFVFWELSFDNNLCGQQPKHSTRPNEFFNIDYNGRFLRAFVVTNHLSLDKKT